MDSRSNPRSSRRGLLSTLGAVSAGLLAGCSSDSDAPSDSSGTDGGDGGTDGGDGGTDGGTGGADATWKPFEFARPVTYTYEVYSPDDGEGTLVWDVTDVTDAGATVSVRYDTTETQFETTVTGTKEDLQSQLIMTPAGPFVIATVFSPTMAQYEGRTLRVGNEWSYSSSDGSMRFEVTEQRSYAGVDCYVSVTEIDGNTVHEGCFSPELEMAPYTAYYDENGRRTYEMSLVSVEE
ncbi:hypothetical protein [Natrinema gelatinilyticum]|uniref:hypothetical protein n=1 Tax=Natrinema gelatinilyticum TaxID=2961571 RepID=UPI0020C1E622|nr:hypothetical protein [Natrinema gelatinilyticum]